MCGYNLDGECDWITKAMEYTVVGILIYDLYHNRHAALSQKHIRNIYISFVSSCINIIFALQDLPSVMHIWLHWIFQFW